MAEIDDLQDAPAAEVLRWAITKFGDLFGISTSFQYEGMVLVDMASRISSDVRVVTLDTGRLPEETYEMMETVRSRYGVSVEVVSPQRDEVEAMVTQHGANLFYASVPQRMLCCNIRKVRPLAWKLEQFAAYAVGLRRSQTDARSTQFKVEQSGKQFKLSPLVDWTPEQVSEYTSKYDVPRHPLYAQGYTSIGCGPCTRATQPGEDERAGRWWWETDTQKECGLHFSPSGKVERTIDVLLREVLENSNA